MRLIILYIAILIALSAILYGQERIDVVYLKNGDIRKGVIIENIPNNYIKLETEGGSIYTIKYADIEKITKEDKPAISQKAKTKSGLMTRTGDFGLTVGLWLGGEVSLGDFHPIFWPDKEASVLIKFFYDTYVIEQLGVGVYMHFSPLFVEESEDVIHMYEFGGSIKPRFPIADGAAVIKPGVGIGYRVYSSPENPHMDEINSMGLNVSVEVQFDAKSTIVPYFEIGFLSQPVGGNINTDVTFPPFIYFGVGIAF